MDEVAKFFLIGIGMVFGIMLAVFGKMFYETITDAINSYIEKETARQIGKLIDVLNEQFRTHGLPFIPPVTKNENISLP